MNGSRYWPSMYQLPPWLSATAPQWISAATAALALFVAWRASNAWQRTLQSKRGDDAIVSIFDLEAAIGRLRARFGRDPIEFERSRRSESFTLVYDALHDWKKNLEIVSRSHPELRASSAEVLEALLGELEYYRIPEAYTRAPFIQPPESNESAKQAFIQSFGATTDRLQAEAGAAKLVLLRILRKSDAPNRQ